MEDFNVGVEDVKMSDFCSTYDLNGLIKIPDSFQKPITKSNAVNCPLSFQNSFVLETGQSDFHRITSLKITLFKGALPGLSQFLATESPLKMTKNTFYFTLEALFVLKTF